MDGDSNQDTIDNTFCGAAWTAQTKNKNKQYVLESQAFPGVTHMDMVYDKDVLAKIQTILMSYKAK